MTETKELAKVEASPLVQANQAIDMQSLFRLAIEKGPDGVESLERLEAMKERMDKRQAAKDFAGAMAEFRQVCPRIPRVCSSKKATRDGGFGYDYADLETIDKYTKELLGEHGFYVNWGDAVESDGAITMACIVTHASGHSESSSVTLPIDKTGSMMLIQKSGTTITYLRRYSMINAVGLMTCDPDNDGAANGNVDRTPISEDAVRDLNDLLVQAGYDTDQKKQRFLKWLKVESLSELPADRLDSAFDALQKMITEAAKV